RSQSNALAPLKAVPLSTKEASDSLRRTPNSQSSHRVLDGVHLGHSQVRLIAPGGAALASTPRPTLPPQHAVFVVSRPDSVQATLQLGTFGPMRSDPDFEAAE